MEKWNKPEIVELHSQLTEAGRGRGNSNGKRKDKGNSNRPPICIIGPSGPR